MCTERALWCEEQKTCKEIDRCTSCPLNWTDRRKKWWLGLSKKETGLREQLAYWQWGQQANKAMLNNGRNEDIREEILKKIKSNKAKITMLKHELYNMRKEVHCNA